MNRSLFTIYVLLLCVFISSKSIAQCPLSITAQPIDTTICSGNDAAFGVVVSNADTLQWQVSTDGGTIWSDITNSGVYTGATSDTLKITTATAAMSNYLYRCITTNLSSTCSLISDTVSLLVDPPPAITVQPADVAACNLGNATFSVTATNVAAYQWQLSTNGGSTWSNLNNATNTSYTTTGINASMQGYKYRCILTTDCNIDDTTNEATLTVNPPATVTTHPVDKSICPNGNTTFTAAGTGFGTIYYKWEVSTDGGTTWNLISNGGVYSGATINTLSITGATTSMDSYRYRATVVGTCYPPAFTNSATLTVLVPPAVASSPSDTIVCANTNAYFKSSGTGSSLTYQWQVSTDGGTTFNDITNGAVYAGATTDSLSLISLPSSMHNNRYRCKINSICGPTVTTSAALLTVGADPVVTTQPSSITVCTGTNSSMSIAATGFTISYQWEVSTDMGANWNDVTNGGVYTGATTNTLQFINPTVTMDGYMYRCVVTNTCNISATSNAVTLTIQTAPVIGTQPADETICMGDNVNFSVAAAGAYTISYQWQSSTDGINWSNLTNTGVFSGVTTNTLTLTSPFIGVHTKYRCVLNTGCVPAITTNTVTLTINTAPDISIDPTSQVKCLGENAAFAISATGTNLSYQWEESTDGGSSWNNISNGGAYSGATTSTLFVSNTTAAMDGYKYRCAVSGTCPTAQTSGIATLTVNIPVALTSNTPSTLTFCAGADTSLAVSATGTGISYQWYRNVGGIWTALTNSGIYSGVNTATLDITGIIASPSTEIYVLRCVVTGTCNTVSSNFTTITVYAKPAIVTNPADVTKCDSSHNASFKVIATGTNLSYQWQLNTGGGWNNLSNNSTYTGATTSELLMPNVYLGMTGYQYRCIISGTCSPTVTTSVATLTVIDQVYSSVTISASDTDICQNTSVSFTPSPVNGGSNPAYVWKVNGATAGTGSTFNTTTLAHSDLVWCEMTSNAACPVPVTSRSINTITMRVTPTVTPTITITSDAGTTWCIGKPLVFRANITNGGTNPTYEWQVNGVTVGTSADTYLTSQLLNGDIVTCKLTSSLRCPSQVTVTSNQMAMSIQPVTLASIVIAPNPDSVICNKTEVTMFTFFTNGGATPSFQWMLNGNDIAGANAGTYKASGIKDGDIIQCRFTSSAQCVFPEISNPVEFDVVPLIDPSVNVTVYYIGNDTYRFTAIPVNGGSNPSYQWYKNTVPISGATSETYDAVGLSKSDKIHVQMSSSEECVNPDLLKVSSKKLTTGVGNVVAGFAELGLYPNPNNGQFSIKGKLNNPVTDKEVIVKITSSLGQTVFTQSYPTNGTNFNLPVQLYQDLPNGMYQVNVAIDGNVTNMRFVLNR